MSRYTIYQGKHQFFFGWDRPLQYYFLTVVDTELESDESNGIVFDNLNRNQPGMTISEIQEIMRHYSVEMPPIMEQKLKKDPEIEGKPEPRPPGLQALTERVKELARCREEDRKENDHEEKKKGYH